MILLVNIFNYSHPTPNLVLVYVKVNLSSQACISAKKGNQKTIVHATTKFG